MNESGYAGGKIIGHLRYASGICGIASSGVSSRNAVFKNLYTYVNMDEATANDGKNDIKRGNGEQTNCESYYSYSDAKEGWEKLAGISLSGAGKAVHTYLPTGSTHSAGEEYPFPAVVREVTGYRTNGSPIYGDYVHYGDWPTEPTSGDPGVPEGPGIFDAPVSGGPSIDEPAPVAAPTVPAGPAPTEREGAAEPAALPPEPPKAEPSERLRESGPDPYSQGGGTE